MTTTWKGSSFYWMTTASSAPQPLSVPLWITSKLHNGQYETAAQAKKAIGASKSWGEEERNKARQAVDAFFGADKDKAPATKAPKSTKTLAAPATPAKPKTLDKEEDVLKAKKAGGDVADEMLAAKQKFDKVPDASMEKVATGQRPSREAGMQPYQGKSPNGGASSVTYSELTFTAQLAKDMPGDLWKKIADRVAEVLLLRLS